MAAVIVYRYTYTVSKVVFGLSLTPALLRR